VVKSKTMKSMRSNSHILIWIHYKLRLPNFCTNTKYEKSLGYDACDLNNYIKDKFYDTMQHKNEHKRMRRWMDIQSVKPKNISSKSHYILPKLITASSVKRGCKMKHALVRSFGQKSYWQPNKSDDKTDFLQIDLGRDYFIEAISTRGRVLRRTKEYEIDWEKSTIEYVKKYKVMIRKDDGKKNATHQQMHRRKQKNRESEINEDFVNLGIFEGNKDSETEIAHKLKLKNDNKIGVTARYVRVYPLNLSEGGYCGKKSMRIGLYGNGVDNGKYSEEKNVNDCDEHKGDLIHNKDVPAAIITIRQPSETNKRNCWAQNHRCIGVNSCSCYNCSTRLKARHARRGLRNDFKKQVKALKNVKDYGLDEDAIVYQRFRAANVW